jgi:deoxyribonuclease V
VLDVHRWDMSPKEARLLQVELAGRVRMEPLPENFSTLGAADIAYVAVTNQLVATILTFEWPNLTLIEASHVVAPIEFPYIPGLLSFREVPPLLKAHKKLQHPPEVLLCDGQGIAHPRRLGLASHLGLCLGIPTIGCAKEILCGNHDDLELRRGSSVPLYFRDEIVGWVLCSRDGIKPIYVSPGHLSDLESSKRLICRSLGRFRIPEPLRQAHNMATRLRRAL